MDDEKDETLWQFVTRQIKPIEQDRKTLGSEGDESQEDELKDVHPKDNPNTGKTRPVIVQPRDDKRMDEPGGHGLDRRSAEKLRKGQMPIEGRLDLHGMTQEQGHKAVQDFIIQGQAAGKRCVLIITGKGRDAQGQRDPLSKGQGVLKRMVPHWLEQKPLAPLILKTELARPQHGGEGALYVLLRRRRH